jgi:hypothetical protein
MNGNVTCSDQELGNSSRPFHEQLMGTSASYVALRDYHGVRGIMYAREGARGHLYRRGSRRRTDNSGTRRVERNHKCAQVIGAAYYAYTYP